jgi:putative ABC transport system ATP-binding protein
MNTTLRNQNDLPPKVGGTSVELRLVSKRYEFGVTKVHALRSVSLEIDAGKFIVLTGPSGSGKTTLLNVISLIESPDEGQLFLNSDDISAISEGKKNMLRREMIGIVFQQFNLIPVLTAFENVRLGLPTSLSQIEANQRVMTALAMVGLSNLERRRPAQLSGGQQQRVGIARAIAKHPLLIVADEPTANLDSENGSAIIDLFKEQSKILGATIIVASHDPMVAAAADRCIKVKDGKLC